MKSISASSMNVYNTCPLQWYFNYEFKLLQLPNPAFIVGTAYHKALELFHQGRNEKEIKSYIKDLLLSENKTKEEVERFALVASMFRKYKENPVDGEVIDMEYNFSQEVPGIPVKLYGFVDRVDVDKIVEYKTSSFDYQQKDIQVIQSKIYTYVVFRQKNKILPVVYSVNNKKKANKNDYKPQKLSITYTEKDMEDLEKELFNFYQLVVNDKKFEHKRGNHCYWCAYGSKGTNNCKYSL